VIGPFTVGQAFQPDALHPLPSPGLLPRHYAPRTPLECIEPSDTERIAALQNERRRIGWVTFGDPISAQVPGVVVRVLPADPAGYAAQLYAALHELDRAELDRILVTLPPDTHEWLAVRDRLRRAASGTFPLGRINP
jgi:L-threonylcarbamoyladenylate synthase